MVLAESEGNGGAKGLDFPTGIGGPNGKSATEVDGETYGSPQERGR